MSRIPTHLDLQSYVYDCDELGEKLVCFLDYEPADPGYVSRDGEVLSPAYPEVWSLMHVYLPDGRDIYGILHPNIVSDIEEAAAEFHSSSAANDLFDYEG